jgi:hypothetical protein
MQMGGHFFAVALPHMLDMEFQDPLKNDPGLLHHTPLPCGHVKVHRCWTFGPV